MSGLEPDAPAPHVFPHWREAVRAWYAHRTGTQQSRASIGEVRGKGPATGDVLRVGRVLGGLGLLTRSGGLTRHGQSLVGSALGLVPRSNLAVGSHGVEVLVARVTRQLRRAGLIAPHRPRLATRRLTFVDANDGQAVTTTIIVKTG